MDYFVPFHLGNVAAQDPPVTLLDPHVHVVILLHLALYHLGKIEEHQYGYEMKEFVKAINISLRYKSGHDDIINASFKSSDHPDLTQCYCYMGCQNKRLGY